MPRRRAWLPWAIWAVGMVVLGVTLTLSALNLRDPGDRLFLPLAAMMVLGYTTVGALLAARNPRNPMGWLMEAIGVLFVLGGFTDEYVTYALETRRGALPGAILVAWVGGWVWGALLAMFPFLVLLFPTGRVPGPRWRFLPPLILALAGIAVVSTMLMPGPLEVEAPVELSNPTGVEALDSGLIRAIGGASWVGLMVAQTAAVASLVVRYRRSSGEERQQIRWIAYIAGATGIVVVVGLVLGLILGDRFEALGEIVWLVTFALVGIGIPAAMGVAILKYRLYDLDLVVKKTVLYGIVAVLLLAVFLVVAVSIGALAGRTETGAIAAAAAIGLSFWPALRISRRVADRVVYGGRATPYEVLTEFSAQLGAPTAPTTCSRGCPRSSAEQSVPDRPLCGSWSGTRCGRLPPRRRNPCRRRSPCPGTSSRRLPPTRPSRCGTEASSLGR